MNLTATSDILRIRLSNAMVTNHMHWITSWKTLTISTHALGNIPRLAGRTNGVTDVTIVTSPTATDSIQVKTIWVLNTDTVTHTVTIEFYDGVTATTKKVATLQAGQALEYTEESGRWIVYAASGQPIGETGANGADGANGANGALTVTETEIDFGVVPVREKQFTITDAGVSATSKIIAVQSGKAATGRDADENEMDALILNCKPATGQFVLNAFAMPGPVTGKYKVNYQFS